MVIKGGEKGNAEIVASMIAKEWAFAIKWKTTEARVGFFKGEWYIGKYKEGHLIDSLQFSDAPSIMDCSNSMLSGLLEMLEQTIPESGILCRTRPSKILTQAMEIWLGKMEDIQSVDVFQTGRNSFIDWATGELTLNL